MVGVETLKGPRPTPIGSQKGPQKGRLRRPGEQSVQAQRAKPSTATENRERPYGRRNEREGRTGGPGASGAPGKRATEGSGVWGGAPSREPSFQTAKLPSLQTSKLPNKKPLNFQTSRQQKKPPTGEVGGFCRVGPNYSAAGVSAGASAAGALSTHSRTHISVASPRRKPSLVMRV